MNLNVNLSTICSLSRAKKFVQGDTIPCDGLEKKMYVVIKGEAAAFPAVGGQKAQPVAVYGPGEFFGEATLFLESKPDYNYAAQTDLIVLQINRCSFSGFLREEPELAFELMRAFCARLEDALKRGHQDSSQAEAAGSSTPPSGFPIPGEPSPVSRQISSDAPFSLFPAGHGQYHLPLQSQDRVYLMEKQYTCPLCSHGFKGLKVKQSKLSVLSVESDMRIRYKGVEPLYYEVVTCPHCLYSALEVMFASPDRLEKSLRQELEAFRAEGDLRFGLELDVRSMFAGYYLAMYCAPSSFTRSSFAEARLLLNLSRLYNDCGDERMERQAVDRALEAYLNTYENSAVSPTQLPQLCMVIGSLSATQGDYDTARKFFFEAKTHRNCPPNLKRQAEDRLYDLRLAERQRELASQG